MGQRSAVAAPSRLEGLRAGPDQQAAPAGGLAAVQGLASGIRRLRRLGIRKLLHEPAMADDQGLAGHRVGRKSRAEQGRLADIFERGEFPF